MFRFLILLFACSAVLGALPKGWKPCKRSNPNYSKCLGRQIENAIKSLVDGYKPLGVMSLDPLKISSMEIGKSNGPVTVQITITDAEIYGIKNVKVIDAKNDWKTMTVKIGITPKLQVLCNFKGNGKILVLPLKSEGKGDFTFDNLIVDAEIKWKRVNKGGTEHFNMESLTMHLKPEKLTTKLENLLGEGELSGQVNTFLNQNWKIIMEEMREPVSDSLSSIFLQMANQILNKIPANEIDI